MSPTRTGIAAGRPPLAPGLLLAWSGGHPWPVAVCLIALSVVTLVSVWLAAETHRASLEE